MKLDGARIIADLKAKALPMAEKDLIIAVDTILNSIKAQAAEQPADPWAVGVGMVMGPAQSAIDAELAKVLPDSASV